jgi:hypothetical protein
MLPGSVQFLHYPAAAVRIGGCSVEQITEAAVRLLDSWRSYDMCTALNSRIGGGAKVNAAVQTCSFVAFSDPTQAGKEGALQLIMIPRTQVRLHAALCNPLLVAQHTAFALLSECSMRLRSAAS